MLARAGQREVSAIRSRGVTATQGFLQTLLKAISVWTPVSVRYRAGVRNSGVSVKRGSTVHLFGLLSNLDTIGTPLPPICHIDGEWATHPKKVPHLGELRVPL